MTVPHPNCDFSNLDWDQFTRWVGDESVVVLGWALLSDPRPAAHAEQPQAESPVP